MYILFNLTIIPTLLISFAHGSLINNSSLNIKCFERASQSLSILGVSGGGFQNYLSYQKTPKTKKFQRGFGTKPKNEGERHDCKESLEQYNTKFRNNLSEIQREINSFSQNPSEFKISYVNFNEKIRKPILEVPEIRLGVSLKYLGVRPGDKEKVELMKKNLVKKEIFTHLKLDDSEFVAIYFERVYVNGTNYREYLLELSDPKTEGKGYNQDRHEDDNSEDDF